MSYKFNSETQNLKFGYDQLAMCLDLVDIANMEEKGTMIDPLRILLADDEAIVYQTISGYLADLGHDVDKASDAIEALRSVREKEYDLAIVDIRMPGMDGISLLSKLRKIRPEMLVVIMTGHGNMEMAVEALKLGAIEFLIKPVRLIEIDAVLEKAKRLQVIFLQHLSDMEKLRKTDEKLRIEIAKREEAEKALKEAEKRYLLVIEELKSVGGNEFDSN